MHGIIFSELKKYVDTKFGGNTWSTLLKESGLGPKAYMPVQEYPDADVVAIVATAAKLTGKPATAILEDFGEFIVPDLVGMYRSMIKPEWKTLDLLEYVEGTIHKVVRLKNPGAKPPELVCNRVAPNQVVIDYSSARKLCAVAKGMAKGVAKHYNDKVVVTETACMHKGASVCKISVKLAA